MEAKEERLRATTIAMVDQPPSVRASYDEVAQVYAEHICDELEDKPFDRWMLGRAVDLAAGGPVVDAGCGPGHVTDFLADLGADVTGIDLSEEMVAEAWRRYPSHRFEQGDIRDLPAPEGGWAVIVAFYSLIHFETDDLAAVCTSLRSRLRPGGYLLVAVHAGEERLHLDDWWEHDVSLDFVFHPPERLAAAIADAGFTVLERIVRSPYEGREHLNERAYVLARAPG